ncbi:signal transduction histidine-protein kinase BaeS [Clostridiales bacterium]|nr:signal transduction histidine-protein kinase BaeS [Clostridiales bacterium]
MTFVKKKKSSLFFKQTEAYILIFLVAFAIIITSVYYFCTDYYFDQKETQMKEYARSIARQYGRAFSSGIIDITELQIKMEVIEDYTGTSIFLLNSFGRVSAISSSIDQEWIGQSITNDTVNSVLGGNVVTVRGKGGGMFSENMMTVGYPIMSSGVAHGGIFICSPVPEIQQTIRSVMEILIMSGCLGLILAVLLIYFFSKKLTKPLLEMNRAAQIIADGNFDRRLEVTFSDEIGQLGESFNYMAERLEKKDQERRLFIASIAHDLRSPLTSIQGFIVAMRDGVIPEDKYDYYMGVILEETERLSMLTNNIVDMGGTQESVLKLDIKEFDLNGLIRDVLDIFEHRFREKKLSCQVVLAEGSTLVMADRNEIHRVLHNLIDNSVKFTPEGGVVEIETNVPKNENKVYVAVRDSGMGIPDSERRNIFGAFYKSDSSRGLDKTGSGLGLCAVKEILNAHKEIIVCRNSKFGGAEFEFSLRLS